MFDNLRQRVAVGALGAIATTALGGIATTALTSTPAHAATNSAQGISAAGSTQQSDIRAALQTATVSSNESAVNYPSQLCPA